MAQARLQQFIREWNSLPGYWIHWNGEVIITICHLDETKRLTQRVPPKNFLGIRSYVKPLRYSTAGKKDNTTRNHLVESLTVHNFTEEESRRQSAIVEIDFRKFDKIKVVSKLIKQSVAKVFAFSLFYVAKLLHISIHSVDLRKVIRAQKRLLLFLFFVNNWLHCIANFCRGKNNIIS